MNNNYNFRYMSEAIPRNFYTPMPFPKKPSIGSKITFTNILNGTSKTLEVINQAIPIFYRAKPVINNAKTMFKIAKGINSKDTNTQKSKTKAKEEKPQNSPTFYI